MSKEKILIVTPYLPYPINSGGAQAQYHMINYLRKHLHISLAYTYTPGKKTDQSQDILKTIWPEVTFYPFPVFRDSFIYRKCKRILKALHRWPDEINRNSVNPVLTSSFDKNFDYIFIDFLDHIIQENDIRLMQFEFPKFQNLVYGFPEVKRIFIQHEIQFIRNLRFLRNLDDLSACDTYQYRMLKATEIAAMQACDAVVVLTEIDKQILIEEKVNTPIFVSPAIIPIPDQPISETFHFKNKLIFLGSSDHRPNLEGIMWFLENVWNHILEKKSDTKLQIIGKWQHRFINQIKNSYRNVELLGYVPSIEPYLDGAIMIVPILTGSGMRMKIVDAANHGIPFITTRVGVEGMDFRNDEECFIEDTPLLFTEKTLELMTNTDKQEKFRRNAQDRIKHLFPTHDLLEKRLNIYRALSDSK